MASNMERLVAKTVHTPTVCYAHAGAVGAFGQEIENAGPCFTTQFKRQLLNDH